MSDKLPNNVVVTDVAMKDIVMIGAKETGDERIFRDPSASEVIDPNFLASIKEEGVQQNVLLVPGQGKHEGKFILVAGRKRFRANAEAKRTTIPAAVVQVDYVIDPDKAIQIMAEENSQRADKHILDTVALMQTYEENYKGDKKGINDKMQQVFAFTSRRTFFNVKSLYFATPKLQKAMRSGKITQMQGIDLCVKFKEDAEGLDAAVQKILDKLAGKGKATRNDTKVVKPLGERVITPTELKTIRDIVDAPKAIKEFAAFAGKQLTPDEAAAYAEKNPWTINIGAEVADDDDDESDDE